MCVLGRDKLDDAMRRQRQRQRQWQQIPRRLSPLPLSSLPQIVQQSQRSHASRGFSLLLLIPIVVGALLVLVIVFWLLVHWRRKRNKRQTALKRADSALLPIVDPAALLSPASREYDRQSPRGAALSFLSPSSPAVSATAPQTPAAIRAACGGGITSAQSTALYRALHSDPNVSAHRLAFHKIAFERRLATHTSSRTSSFQRTAKAARASSPASTCTAQRACETWLCQYEGEEIAVKVLARRSRSCDHAAHFEALQRLVDEIQLTASLEHVNVVRFLGIAWDSTAIESLCMITEYLSAGDLQSMLHTRNTDASARWDRHMLHTIRSVAGALQYLHARGVVHRGVRTKNIAFSHLDSEPKLVNIGATRHYPCSSWRRPLDAQQSLLQDAYEYARFWTAPEVLSGVAVCSEWSDIYAFGALLLEIDANGQLPYEDDDAQDLGRGVGGSSNDGDEAKDSLRHAAPAIVFSAECPPRIAEIARLCLCAEPEQRVDASTLTQLLDDYVSSTGDGGDSVVTTGAIGCSADSSCGVGD